MVTCAGISRVAGSNHPACRTPAQYKTERKIGAMHNRGQKVIECMGHCECLLCHLVTPQNLQAWHTITLLCFKATQTILNSAQDSELHFQIGFLIGFYSQIPALVKPKLKSTETIRLLSGLPHRHQESKSADSLYKASEKNRSPSSSQVQTKCASATQPPSVATRQARAEVGEVCWCHMFTLHSGHLGIVSET